MILIVFGLCLSIIFSASSYNIELKSVTMYENSQLNYGISDVWGYTDEYENEYVILGYLQGTKILDVSTDPENPILIMDIPGPSENDIYFHRDFKTYGDVLYTVCEMTGGDMGMQVIDLSPLPENPPIQYPTYNAIGTSHNLWIDNNGYAFIEHSWGDAINIADLSNPLQPIQVGSFGFLGENTHDIFTRDGIAYVSNGWSENFLICDISNINDIEVISTIEDGITGYAHNAWPTDNNNYLVTTEETENKTVKIWDIQDLSNINLVGEYLAENGLAHNVHVKESLIYISHYTTGLRIVDIYDPRYPVEVAGWDTYPQSDEGGYYGCWGAYPYTQNGYIYATDIQNGLYVFDFIPIYAGWLSGYIFDVQGNPLPLNTKIQSDLDNRKFFVKENGYIHIGMPSGQHSFSVYLGDTSVGDFTYSFQSHTTLDDNIYLTNEILQGDPTGDGLVNILDILETINFINGQSIFNEIQTVSADLNNDENINILDIILITNIILGSS